VFGKGVDAAPRRNDTAVEELLASARGPQPRLPDEQQQRHDDAVGDERAAHDEVRETLAQVVVAAVSHGDDPAEEHLGPRDDGHCLAQPAVNDDHSSPASSSGLPAKHAADPPFLLLKVKFQTYSETDLHNEHEN
jgi:hypothetical protein